MCDKIHRWCGECLTLINKSHVAGDRLVIFQQKMSFYYDHGVTKHMQYVRRSPVALFDIYW